MMKLFSYSQAKYLADYYSKKIIGKPLSPTSSIISHIEIEQYADNRYKVNVYGSSMGSIIPYKDIYYVALNLDLLSPDKVLDVKKE